MSARKEYLKLSEDINVDGDIAGRTGKMAFGIAEDYYPGKARRVLGEMTEFLSGAQFSDEQVLLLSHAVNGSEWAEVRLDIDKHGISKEECKRMLKRMRRYKI